LNWLVVLLLVGIVGSRNDGRHGDDGDGDVCCKGLKSWEEVVDFIRGARWRRRLRRTERTRASTKLGLPSGKQ
jgi:hypothetical protein